MALMVNGLTPGETAALAPLAESMMGVLNCTRLYVSRTPGGRPIAFSSVAQPEDSQPEPGPTEGEF